MILKFEAELKEAIQFELEVTEEYAKHLLVIFNNAREYPEEFLDVHNNYRNSIFVTCPNTNSSIKNMKEFLEWHGEILEQRRVLICKPEYIYTKQSEEYLDNIFKSENAPYEIVSLAPETLY